MYEMAKLNSEKQKNYAFTKKKRLVGLTPGDDHLHNTSWGVLMIIRPQLLTCFRELFS